MFTLIFFSAFLLIYMGIVIYKFATKEFYLGEDWFFLVSIVFFGVCVFFSYREYKVGPLGYLVDDYGFTYKGNIKGVDHYSKKNIDVSYDIAKFNRTTKVTERLNNDLDTKLHFYLLMDDFEFNKSSLNIIFEYLTEDPNSSKEIYIQGNHRHITIGYNSEDELLYYEIIVEYYEHSSGTGDDKKVEKNPNYDKYKKYEVIFINYNKEDIKIYDNIATSILGDNVEPKVSNYDYKTREYKDLKYSK